MNKVPPLLQIVRKNNYNKYNIYEKVVCDKRCKKITQNSSSLAELNFRLQNV